jgi:hypothetical protein
MCKFTSSAVSATGGHRNLQESLAARDADELDPPLVSHFVAKTPELRLKH